MRSYFIFNGVDTRDYHINVTGQSVYNIPMRNVSTVTVPGRNGDVVTDLGAYNNTTLVYHCELSGRGNGFKSAFSDFAERLSESQKNGYCELRDSYNPDEIRQGYIVGEISASPIGVDWSAGSFDVSISCKPQVWLESVSIDSYLAIIAKGNLSSTGVYTTGTKYVSTPIYVDKGCAITLRNMSNISQTIKVYQYKKAIVNPFITAGNAFTIAAGEVKTVQLESETDYVRFVWNTIDMVDTVLVAKGKFVQHFYGSCAKIENNSKYSIKPKITMSKNNVSLDEGLDIAFENCVLTVYNFVGGMLIDCENMTCYNPVSGASQNHCVWVESENFDFPIIQPGTNVISVSGEAATSIVPALSMRIQGNGVKYG